MKLTNGYGSLLAACAPALPGWADDEDNRDRRSCASWCHNLSAGRAVPRPPPHESRRAGNPRSLWLYRQYVAGLGEQAEAAEDALRAVPGAARSPGATTTSSGRPCRASMTCRRFGSDLDNARVPQSFRCWRN